MPVLKLPAPLLLAHQKHLFILRASPVSSPGSCQWQLSGSAMGTNQLVCSGNAPGACCFLSSGQSKLQQPTDDIK